MADSRDLSLILEAKLRRETRPDASTQVVGEMKSSLQFQFSWEELLQCAPTAISAMGACFLASTSDKARVELTPPEKGFTYLRYTSVQANLVECGNLGRMAFLEAENGMGAIQMTSAVISGKIIDIVTTIGDPPSAKKMLKPQFATIKNGATTCYEKANAMDQKFANWLLYVCELHAACTQQENDIHSSLLSTQINMMAEQSRLDHAKSTADEAKKASDLMGKQVDLATQTFKKTSDEYPNGWDLLGQQIVSDLAGSVAIALNAAVPSLLDSLSPMAKVSAGADVVGGFVKPAPNNGATIDGSNAANAPPSGVAKQASDPAYPEAFKINSFLSMMQVIVSGAKADGGIDWEMARGGNDARKTSIGFIASVLADSKQSFASVATNAEPSLTLNAILDTVLPIATAIEGLIKNQGLTSTFPAKDTEQVKKWQSDFAVAYGKASTLRATASSIPGNSANGIPLMTQDPDMQTAENDAKSAQAQAVLEAAKNRLSTTQQILTTAQDNYVKSTDVICTQKNKLADIQATLIRLTASNVQLAEIKKILIECIKLIISMKQQITSLVRFFKAIASVVDMSTQYHVTPFLRTIESMISNDGADPNKEYKIGDYTLTDLQRSQLYASVLTLRSYFSVFGDIAKMWVTLSKDSVIPGLRLCDELSITADDRDSYAMKKKFDTLNRWSTDASNRVSEIAQQRQGEVKHGIESRIDEIARTIKNTTAPTAETLNAITSGIEVNKSAAQASIDQRAAQNPLWRFANTDN